MHEVATDLGGEELADRVAQEAASDGLLPNANGLKLLEDLHPGSTDLVITRMSEIRHETNQRELAESRKPSIRKYGKALMDGFASFSIFGNSPNRR